MTQRLSIIVAMAKNRVIGKNGALPWHLSADLKHFKALTLGSPIIMGRKTYESIGRALPGRKTVIVTRQPGYARDRCTVVSSVPAALAACGDAPELFVTGGEDIFRQVLERAQRIYLTEIQANFDGDTSFPEFDLRKWREISRERHISPDGLEYHFVVYDKSTDP